LFGQIKDREMILNDAGIMSNNWYVELGNKINDTKCWGKTANKFSRLLKIEKCGYPKRSTGKH